LPRSAFVASIVEFVEALTIVLAVGPIGVVGGSRVRP
jgi:uncharacterized membrane protein